MFTIPDITHVRNKKRSAAMMDQMPDIVLSCCSILCFNKTNLTNKL